DILLTDIKMPFMDGLELAENVMKKYPQTKMVIFSGYGEFEYARKAMKSGVDSYILKPVDPEEFRNTMEKVLQEIEGERLEDERKEKNRNFVREHVLLSPHSRESFCWTGRLRWNPERKWRKSFWMPLRRNMRRSAILRSAVSL
ncbi:response regulator, partial [Jutongia sp.]|uniref:response regulator n=1 Tax=Jutongia sp. TaxID=2944204 RepID=UPI00307AA22D